MEPENAIHPQTAAEWRAWLAENHGRDHGVWLIYYKMSSGKAAMSYEEMVEEALCFGWVDSKGNRLDEERTMLYFAPRKPGSGWSRPNKERVERLLADGRMQAAGLAKINAAQADGSWTLLDSVEALEVPADLAESLAHFPHAAANFAAFPHSSKRAILQWIVLAKRPETRARRIAETARLAEDNIRANERPRP